ncbi:uncharacterized protein [Watersipora subatra]|uniref:uncharacterized protein n=1 Tax=Watersipora subatra TaxID=2589382 RepID=UPI00355BC963
MREVARSPTLAVYNSGKKGSYSLGEDSTSGGSKESSGSTNDNADLRDSCNTLDSDSYEHSSLIMGNNSSATGNSLQAEGTLNNSSKLGRIRATLHSQGPRKHGKDQNIIKKHSEDTENNNKLSSLDYADSITRSTTLPNNIHKINGCTGSPLMASTLNSSATQARLLPAYKLEDVTGNNQQRQRIASSPAYTSRSRHNSQSSAYSHRPSTAHRSPAIHIRAHPDKRLMRSKSVGVIPAAQLRVRRTTSASVVKLDDCEDWAV